jgi:hypothetical protein
MKTGKEGRTSMDFEQERKLERILDLIHLPEEQPRDEKGRYTSKKTEEYKSDLDKVDWFPVGDNVFVRRRKIRYVLYDCAILFSILVGVMLVV